MLASVFIGILALPATWSTRDSPQDHPAQDRVRFEARAQEAIRKADKDLDGAIEALIDLADMYQRHGDPIAAVAAVESAVELAKNAPPLVVAELQATLGQHLLQASDLRRAVPLLESALAKLDEQEGAEVPANQCRVNLAKALAECGDLARSRELLTRAVDALRAHGTPGDLAVAMLNLADAELQLADLVAARQHADEAIVILDSSGEDELTKQLARVRRAIVLETAGRLIHDPGTTRHAESELRAAAAAIDEKGLLPPWHPERLQIDSNLGSLLWRRGAVAAACDQSRQVLKKTEDGRRLEPSTRIRVLYGHASLLASSGRLDEARTYMRRAVAEARQHLLVSDMGSDRARAFLFSQLRSVLSSQLSCRDFTVEDAAQAREDLECWLLGRGLAIEQWRRARILADLSAHDGALANELRDLRALAATVHQAASATGAALRVELDRRQAAIAARLGPPQLGVDGIDDLRRLLPAEGALIVTATYLRAALAKEGVATPDPIEHVAAFLLTPDGSVRRIELGTAASVSMTVQAARTACFAPRHPARGIDPEDSNGVHGNMTPVATLLRPVVAAVEALQPAVRQLIICPDGALAALPWAVVPLTKDRIFADQWRITYVDHLAGLRHGEPAKTPPSLLVVADVDYGTSAGSKTTDTPTLPPLVWQPLPGTKRELHVCETIFRQVFPTASMRSLTRDEASCGRLREAIAGRHFVHIATHAFAAGDHRGPIDMVSNASGLVLANANRETGDGILTAAELSCLDLGSCELAFLATCDANSGPRAFGDALTGLHAAVRAAGARAVISSLCSVPDADTARFCEMFYAALWGEGRSPADAFLTAQASARSAGMPARCWAAFAYYGPLAG